MIFQFFGLRHRDFPPETSKTRLQYVMDVCIPGAIDSEWYLFLPYPEVGIARDNGDAIGDEF